MTSTEIEQAAILWRRGPDTPEISQRLDIPEFVVWCHLRMIRTHVLVPWRPA